MPTVLSNNQLQINYNAASLSNAGVRIFCLGTAIAGNGTWQTIIRFTPIGSSNSYGLSFKFFSGAGRQSGTIAENWYVAGYFGVSINATSTGNSFNNNTWISEGNAITAVQTNNSGTFGELRAFGYSGSPCWVETYVEAYCTKWNEISISY